MSHLAVSYTATKEQVSICGTIQSETKVNCWVHNLKEKESWVEARWCCAEVIFLLATKLTGFREFMFQSFSVLLESCFFGSSVRWKMSSVPVWVVIGWVEKCDTVFVTM